MISEKAEVNRLPVEHIRDGNIIWYSGNTSMLQWSCPAEIVEVDFDHRQFRVRSLDDGIVQTQWYDFIPKPYAPESRLSMYVPVEEKIAQFFENGAHFKAMSIQNATEDYLVVFDPPLRGEYDFWLMDRWAKKHNISCQVGLDGALFNTIDDATLCLMTFSSGFRYHMIA